MVENEEDTTLAGFESVKLRKEAAKYIYLPVASSCWLG